MFDNYDVFLSYRHKDLDGFITKSTFEFLESYKLPKAIAQAGHEGVKKVFRDTEELSVSRLLGETIETALKSAKCLIIVCSTDTPHSAWVDREVETFIELGKSDRIFPLLLNGDEETSFPPSLKRVPDIRDRLMDVRSADGLKESIFENCKTELLKVVAFISGCSEQDLKREDNIEKSRKKTRKAAVISAVFIFAAAVSALIMSSAQRSRDNAKRMQTASMSMLGKLTYDLPDRLVDLPGTYSKVAEILKENTYAINNILLLAEDTQDVRSEIAANYEKLATAYTTLGYFDDAIEYEDTAITEYKTLIGEGSRTAASSLVSAYSNKARIMNITGNYADALRLFESAVERARESGDTSSLPLYLANAGASATNLGEYPKAISYLTEAKALTDMSVASETAAQALYNLGIALYMTGAPGDAVENMELSSDMYRQIYESKGSRNDIINYLNCQSVLSVIYYSQGHYSEAKDTLERAIPVCNALGEDEENVTVQQLLAQIWSNYGLILNIQGDLEPAYESYVKASQMYKAIAEGTGSLSDTANYALTCFNISDNRLKLGDRANFEVWVKRGLDIYADVCTSLGDVHTGTFFAWKSLYECTVNANPEQGLRDAQTAISKAPDSDIVMLYHAYALMYAGQTADAEKAFDRLIALGEGYRNNVRTDFASLSSCGWYNEYMDTVLSKMR